MFEHDPGRRPKRFVIVLLAVSVPLVVAGSRSVADSPAASAATLAPHESPAPAANWAQWGGPTGDFHVPATGLADVWPADGPKRLWSRSLGEGYAAIAAGGGKLYTTYRQGNQEIVVAMRADTGSTAWEHRYAATPDPAQTAEFGQGPNATPLLLGGKLFTIGFTGLMHCLDAESGKPLWSHDLVKDFGGKLQYYGYSNSPIAYKNTVITLVGGEKHGVVGLNPADGSVSWKSKPYDVSYAAPILINVDGQDQVVFFTINEVVGIDAGTGAHLWSHLVVNFCRTNCTSAIWGKDNLLWAATKGVGGTRVLKLTQREGKTDVKEVWCNRKIRVYHWNAVRVGDFVYTSSGDRATLLSAINVKTGEFVERQRGFGSTNGIYADAKLIILDDNGQLVLARPSAEGFQILSRTKILDSLTWTVPTLVGRTLYIRDRQGVIALDLG